MKEEDAIEFTGSLTQIVQGSIGLVKKAHDLGIPKAMGFKNTREWVETHFRYVQMPIEERRLTVKNLTDEGYSTREVADIVGVSNATVSNDVKNLTEDPTELEQSQKREAALREQLKLAQTPVAAASKRYGTVVIDPPWPMKKIERDVAPNQVEFDYPTMDYEQLRAWGRQHVVPAMADDCHFFMWTTQKFLPMAFRLLDDYGVKYVLAMVWHKPGGFQPFGLPQYNCEFALYGRVGAPKFIDTKAFNTCFNAPRAEHSRKPDEFYDLVRRVTDGDRIDIFSREKRPGFDQLGNEVDKFTEAA